MLFRSLTRLIWGAELLCFHCWCIWGITFEIVYIQCTHMHIYTHRHTCTYTHAHIHMHIFIHTHAHTHCILFKNLNVQDLTCGDTVNMMEIAAEFQAEIFSTWRRMGTLCFGHFSLPWDSGPFSGMLHTIFQQCSQEDQGEPKEAMS